MYLAIADAVAADILSGRLAPGERLPPQRILAGRLGIDFTTVSRAYAEASRRGLIHSRVGQGTFVRGAARPAVADAAAGIIDLSMNLPPRFEKREVERRLWRGLASLEQASGLDLLLRYQEPGGAMPDRRVGAGWLGQILPEAEAERVLICPGAQGALAAVLGLLAAPGETVLAEALTYPGFRALAEHLRLKLVGLPMDRDGIDPDAFAAACQQHRPKALYCTPTLHNPTTTTMPLPRRQRIVEIARQHGVPVIEDDAYGLLPRTAPPPLSALAPELCYYIGGLAKILSPALRISYLVVPDARVAHRAAGSIRAISAMASPISAALATRWIEDGTASAVLSAIREETAARRDLAARILPAVVQGSHPESFHVWLPLPAPWTRGEFAPRLRAVGIGVVTSDAFALAQPPEAVRIGLGAARTREELERGLQAMADLLAQSPTMASVIV